MPAGMRLPKGGRHVARLQLSGSFFDDLAEFSGGEETVWASTLRKVIPPRRRISLRDLTHLRD